MSLELPFCLKGAFQFPVLGLIYPLLAEPYFVRKSNERAINDRVFHVLCIIKLFVLPFSQQTIGRKELALPPADCLALVCDSR